MEWSKFYTYKDGSLISLLTGKPIVAEDSYGYIKLQREGKFFRVHRVIWEMFNGPIPTGYLVDHIDRNRKNNKIENLRLVTSSQSNANRAHFSTATLPKGVTKVGNKYRARICREGTRFFLGSFSTVEEAEKAYISAATEMDGNSLAIS